eukprot:15450726-Alexandrium_andersonii.AAC.1
MLRGSEGQPVFAPNAAAARWLEHFAQRHGGAIASIDEAMRRHLPEEHAPAVAVLKAPAEELPAQRQHHPSVPLDAHKEGSRRGCGAS